MHGWASRVFLRRPFIQKYTGIPTAYPGLQRWYSTADHEPLRILFCGADDFSACSLNALNNLLRGNRIQSIDVVCRPDKRVGRGLKQIQQVPIKAEAERHGFPLHQLDSFRGWSPPTPINLIITVSFGLLVPARLLDAAQYGGINVHPSILPDLRGAAPIQHNLLQVREEMGVTIQTMHPTLFDHGDMLSQVTSPFVPYLNDPRVVEFRLCDLASSMLSECIETGRFARAGWVDVGRDRKISHAPKITSKDRHIDWQTWTFGDIKTRSRVLNRLWDDTIYAKCKGLSASSKRIIFDKTWSMARLKERLKPGSPVRFKRRTLDYEYHARLVRSVRSDLSAEETRDQRILSKNLTFCATNGWIGRTPSKDAHHEMHGHPLSHDQVTLELDRCDVTRGAEMGIVLPDGMSIAIPRSMTIDGGKAGGGEESLKRAPGAPWVDLLDEGPEEAREKFATAYIDCLNVNITHECKDAAFRDLCRKLEIDPASAPEVGRTMHDQRLRRFFGAEI